jgi:cyclophilin family peptidyl-prolyl cis-trans isomerase/sugar lactone lactonase YvrE
MLMKSNCWMAVLAGWLALTLSVAAQNLTLVQLGTPPKSLSLPYNGTTYSLSMSSLWGFGNMTDPVVQFNEQQLTLKQVGKGESVVFKSLGGIDVQLLPEDAPNTVANFLDYVNSGNYGVGIVHRSQPGFIVQGGASRLDQNSTGFTGDIDPVTTLPAISNEFKLSNIRGTVAMAMVSGNVDSATSQWFINLGNNSASLDPQSFTVFGQVINNTMPVVDALANETVINSSSPLANTPFSQLPVVAYTAGKGTIDKITPGGNLSVLVQGNSSYPQGYSFETPEGVVFGANNTLFVLENGSGSLMEIANASDVLNGTVSTLVSGFSSPQMIAIDGNGTMFVTDPNYPTGQDGNVTLQGAVLVVFPDGQGGIYASGLSQTPVGIVVDANDTVYVTEYANGETGNGTVEKITPTTPITEDNFILGNFTEGNVTTFVHGLTAPLGLARDAQGNLYVSTYATKGTISKITPAGVVSAFAKGFNLPRALALDGSGNLYVTNYGTGMISKVTSKGVVSAFGKTQTPDPVGLALDGSGNLYVSEAENVQLTNLVYMTYSRLPLFGATVNIPNVVTLSSNGFGMLQITPVPGKSGKITVTVSANDGHKKTLTAKIAVTVGVPTVTVPPSSQSVAVGGAANLTAEASDGVTLAGSPIKMTYQWYKDGVALKNTIKTSPTLTIVKGATTNMLQLSNVQPAAQGNYTVHVTNLLGMTVSAPALVTVTGAGS